MRRGGSSIIGILLAIWLVIGFVAALQRGYFGDDREVRGMSVGDTVLTIVAGPLNHMGVNPKVDCEVPEDLPEPSE